MICWWIIFGLALNAGASGPEYCNDVVKALCSSPLDGKGRKTVEQLRSEISASLAKEMKDANVLGNISKSITDGNAELEAASSKKKPSKAVISRAQAKVDSGFRLYGRVINRAQDLILARFKEYGITEKDLSQRLEEIRANVANHVEKVSSFQGTSLGVGPIKIENTIRTARIVTVRSLLNPENEPDAETFYSECGIDGLTSQAFYVGIDHGFRICPGYLLDLLADGSLDGLGFLAAHELGHSVGVEKTYLGAYVSGAGAKRVMLKRYGPFLDCVEKYYAKNFTSIKERKSYIQGPGLQALKMTVASLEQAKQRDLVAIARAKRAIETVSETADEMDSSLAVANQLFPPKANAVQTHALELCADAIGNAEVEAEIAQRPKDAWGIFRRQYRSECPSDGDSILGLKYGALDEDGMHPSGAYRIEAAARNPAIRQALGCRPLNLSPDSPFCGLSGEERPTPTPWQTPTTFGFPGLPSINTKTGTNGG